MAKQTAAYPDCTGKCQSAQHGDVLSAAITKRCVSDSDLCSYFTHTCCCCESVRDSMGRTALHLAASCGRSDLATWLIENQLADINAKDKESRYTALHRAVFYGKIDVAVALIKLGANLSLQDFNGLTFLEHAMLDGFKPSGSSGELFTWGTNSSSSLGAQLPRSVPESMDIFHKEYPNENVRQICINQFHSVILTESGTVYSCGHGQGGRLGLGIQHTENVPKLIKFPFSNFPPVSDRVCITSCSISRDHSLFLGSSGEIFSCGLNKHRVLGIVPPPPELLVPKALKHFAEKGASFVASGNYHSLVWSKSGLFTWGFNAGQLGHPLIDNKYVLAPKRVKCINFNENSIKLVCASTGATVVYTEKGDVYVLHEYQCRKIASRQLNLVQIEVIGGKLNLALDPEFSNKNRELKVAALTNSGDLLLWQESDPVLRRCVFSVNRALNIRQMALNVNHVLFVTYDGEAFKGEAKARKKRAATAEKDKSGTKSDFHKFLEKDECVSVKLERIPRVHRAVNVQSDPKGHNFGAVQERPYKLFNTCHVSESLMRDNMEDLLSSDDVSDVQFNVSGRIFSAHRYVLASRSPYFATLFSNNKDKAIIDLKGFHPAIFEEFLRYIYTGNTELAQPGDLKGESLLRLCLRPLEDEKENVITKERNPVRMLHEMAKRFEVVDLQKALANLDMTKHCVRTKKEDLEPKKTALIFNRNLCPELYDVDILCRDDRVLKAHKCILVARLDYFGSMFSSRWRGDGPQRDTPKITMPFSKGVVEALLEFLYTDSLDRLEEREVDQLFKIIVLADQFFVTRLKDQCEIILSGLLTIKNAVQLLAFADIYNADSLKENCFEFIQQNMTSFLELRLLDDLEGHLLKELSEFYQVRRGLDCRVITPYSTAVSDEEISRISSEFPVDIRQKKEKSGKEKQKKRSRPHRASEKSLLPSSPLFPEPSAPQIEVSISGPSERLKTILMANETQGQIEPSFTVLSRHSFDFPLLSSPPKSSTYHKPQRPEMKIKTPKLSQKQRKRLSSESQQGVVGSPALAESPKNPWKVLQSPTSPLNSPPNDDIGTIIFNERKQKENLVKIQSKQLQFTQLEDKAIEELRKFYGESEDEVIRIERVSLGAIALPTWVPKTKQL